jgi:Tfp pilus assembly protein PilE
MKKLNSRGISLVELLITITVVSIMAIVIMNFMVNWLQQYAITETRSALLTDAQTAVDQMVDAVRLSSSADDDNRWPDTNPPTTGNQFSWTSTSSRLVLASAVENTSNQIVFSDPANYTSQKNNLIFFVSNNALYRRSIAAPVQDNKLKTSCPANKASASCPADLRLARNVSNFSVKYFDGNNVEVAPTDSRSIEISLTLQKRRFSQLIQSVYKTRMVYRND